MFSYWHGHYCAALRRGLAFNTRAQTLMTPLLWAAVHGRTDCARMLIDAGADKEATDMVRVLFALLTHTTLCIMLEFIVM
jgi:hypothetical protein